MQSVHGESDTYTITVVETSNNNRLYQSSHSVWEVSLSLQETSIADADFLDLSLFQIQDYNLITQNRYATAHGGLAYYIHKNWAYTIRTCENQSQ